MSLTVSYEAGSRTIKIKDLGKQEIIIPISSLVDIDTGTRMIRLQKDVADTDIFKHREALVILDTKKDINTDYPTSVIDDVFKSSGREDKIFTLDNLNYGDLKDTEHALEKYSVDQGCIETVSWLNTMKDNAPSEVKQKLNSYKKVFKESGIGPDRLLEGHNEVITFGSFVDPLDHNKTPGCETFPSVGTELVLDQNFMQYLGIPKSKVKSTRITPLVGTNDRTNPPYKFTIQIGSLVFNYDPTKPFKQDAVDYNNPTLSNIEFKNGSYSFYGIDIFAGNASKNGFLNIGYTYYQKYRDELYNSTGKKRVNKFDFFDHKGEYLYNTHEIKIPDISEQTLKGSGKKTYIHKTSKDGILQYTTVFIPDLSKIKNEIGLFFLIKQALIAIKEMGDLLQFAIMFIWKHYGDGPKVLGKKGGGQIGGADDDYIMTTCDQVVFSQAQLLMKNCALTYSDSTEYKVDIFKASPSNTPDKLLEVITDKTNIVLRNNQKYIDFVNNLTINNTEYAVIELDFEPVKHKKENKDPRIYTGAFLRKNIYPENPNDYVTGRLIMRTDRASPQYYIVYENNSVTSFQSPFSLEEIEDLINDPKLVVRPEHIQRWFGAWRPGFNSSMTGKSINFNKIPTDIVDTTSNDTTSIKLRFLKIGDLLKDGSDFFTDRFIPIKPKMNLFFSKDFYVSLSADIQQLNNLLITESNKQKRLLTSEMRKKVPNVGDAQKFDTQMKNNYMVINIFRPVEGSLDYITTTKGIRFMWCNNIVRFPTEEFLRSSTLQGYGEKTIYQIGRDMSSYSSAAQLPTASLPTAQLPTASLPTASLPTASLLPPQTDFSVAPLPDDSFAQRRETRQSKRTKFVGGGDPVDGFGFPDTYWEVIAKPRNRSPEITASRDYFMKNPNPDIIDEFFFTPDDCGHTPLNRDGSLSYYGIGNPLLYLNNKIWDYLKTSNMQFYYDDVRNHVYTTSYLNCVTYYGKELHEEIDNLLVVVNTPPVYNSSSIKSSVSLSNRAPTHISQAKSYVSPEKINTLTQQQFTAWDLAIKKLTKGEEDLLLQLALNKGLNISALNKNLSDQEYNEDQIYELFQNILNESKEILRESKISKRYEEPTYPKFSSIYAGLGGSATRKRGRTHKTKRTKRTKTRKMRS